jgi:outer membrane protein
MKKLMIALAFVLSIFAFSTQAQTKVGHINVEELIMIMPETKAAQAELEAFAAELEAQLAAMEQELEAKVANFQANQAVMTDLTKETKYKEIQDLDQRIQQFRQRAQEELGQKEVQLLTPVIEKAQNAINAVAAEGGYNYILDSSQSKGIVIYDETGNDVMPAVKTKLGL